MSERSAVAEDADARLARRYPPARIPRPVVIGLIAVLAAAGIGWTVWTGLDYATPPASGKLNTYQIVSDTEVRFNITVERTDPETTAVCRVIAQADNFERVGELSVEVGPEQPTRVVIDGEMRTFRRAVSVSLDGCTVR